jgi:hypothetical protein
LVRAAVLGRDKRGFALRATARTNTEKCANPVARRAIYLIGTRGDVS